MSNLDLLVDSLSADLRPVRPLAPPSMRTLGWFAAVLGLGAIMMPFADLHAVAERLHVPDLCVAAIGAVLTALCASFAAFQTSVPGRSRLWALLPLPPLALWIGASSLGCLRAWIAPGSDIPDGAEIRGCMTFLVSVSLPLSVLLVLMLRRAAPMRPNLTACLAGLATAAAAAALLVPFHPHDATASDLAMHAVAVSIIIALNGLAGGRLLDRGALRI
ncbi:NrsF family protein [Methylobacterium brachythecii]|uniref:DUF1109 domain-containing protein n=1 Tax=Methylobacterium brachythecii TaxID=1176177 RepID=A0A7W6F5F0_9HYPH|nr:NrsF family protein [Methylobacterium brachythecii]MBB3900831.1 hypothetical protein [Methylobacterium brachythecii]GLS46053.1 hypothetical protein GCM10007884_40440 [Methylobacterium brachythecii]